MSKFVVRALLACVLLVPSLASASPFVQVGDTLTLQNSVGSISGGEFVAHAAAPSTFDSFVTFCVQLNEHVRADDATAYTVSGIGFISVGSGASTLTAHTAFLYAGFRAGSLPGYDTSSGAHHEMSANALQWAIWSFQGQSPLPSINGATQTLADAFIAAANGAVSSNAWSGVGNVRIVNLVDASGANVQDQLMTVPVPEPAMLLLVGGALVGLAGRLRRRA